MRTEANEENIDKLKHKDKVKFALFCAKQVTHLAEAPEAKECIRVVELQLNGKATAEECKRAANAAYAAYAAICAVTGTSTATAGAAVCAAAHAAYAAIDYTDYTVYAYYAAINAINADKNCKQKIEEYLYELIHINNIIEGILLNA